MKTIEVIKKGVSFIVSLDEKRMFVTTNTGKKASAYWYNENTLKFNETISFDFSGKKQMLNGLVIDDLDKVEEIKNVEIIAKEEASAKKQAEKDEYINGNKKLRIVFHDGEYYQGYAAYGLSAEILDENGCGHWVNNRFFVYDEFADGDIKKILDNGQKNTNKEESLDEIIEKAQINFNKMLDENGIEKVEEKEVSKRGLTYVFTMKNGKIYEVIEKLKTRNSAIIYHKPKYAWCSDLQKCVEIASKMCAVDAVIDFEQYC